MTGPIKAPIVAAIGTPAAPGQVQVPYRIHNTFIDFLSQQPSEETCELIQSSKQRSRSEGVASRDRSDSRFNIESGLEGNNAGLRYLPVLTQTAMPLQKECSRFPSVKPASTLSEPHHSTTSGEGKTTIVAAAGAPGAAASQGRKNKNKTKNKNKNKNTGSSEELSYKLMSDKCACSIESSSTVEPATTAPPSARGDGGENSAGEGEVEERDSQGEVTPPKTENTAPKSTSMASLPAVDRPNKRDLVLLQNVNIANQEDEQVKALIKATEKFSDSVFDEKNCLKDCSKKAGWKLSILTTKDRSIVCGFVIAKVIKGALSINKIAVPSSFRGAGFGKKIMDEMIQSAKRLPGVYEVALSSLPTAVSFYQRLGFKAHWGLNFAKEEGLVEGQVYMDKRIGKMPRK